MKQTINIKYRVNLIESERGWGQTLFLTKYFETLEEANAYKKSENALNTSIVTPDYYMYATEPVRVALDLTGKEISI